MAKIVIAGGTGLIGQKIENLLIEKNHEVFILTRSPKQDNHIAWNPKNKTIDSTKIEGTNHLINLCGESIGEKRWTSKRKRELHDSRIGTNTFLFEQFHGLSTLNQFLSASGINCYPISQNDKVMTEQDAFGTDYLSKLVQDWEVSADLFSRVVPVTKIRISMVLDGKKGALKKLLPLAKWGVLSPMGNGKQFVNWVHIHDVANAFVHAIEKNLDGAFNLTGKPITNSSFTKSLLKSQGRKLLFPKVPAFIMKLILGEQATIVIDGVNADNALLKETGFHYQFEVVDDALKDLFQ